MKHFISLSLLCLAFNLHAADSEEGFVSLCDGKTFKGWKSAEEHTNTWKIEDGAFIAHGERCHLFYVGDEKPFKNFELRVDVMTEPGANGGIYFHTKYQAVSWPTNGFESQVNVSYAGDPKLTGSVYDVASLGTTPAKDNEWWTQTIIVKGDKIITKINGVMVLEYHEPPGVQPGKDFTRKIAEGTFALQAHDPGSVVHYKNIRVKRLD
jgi:hypothetical protein